MKAAKFAIAGLLSLTLLACSSRPSLVVAVQSIEKPQLILPATDKIKLRNVEWTVVTAAVTTEQALKKSKSTSLFAVSAKGYENLSVNTAEMSKAIRQLQAQLKAYEEYYKKIEKEPQNGQ